MNKHAATRPPGTNEQMFGEAAYRREAAYQPLESPASMLTQDDLTRALKPLIQQVTAHNAKMDARAAALEELLEELVRQRSIENVISDVEKVIAPYIEEIERLNHENRILRKRLARRSWWKRSSP